MKSKIFSTNWSWQRNGRDLSSSRKGIKFGALGKRMERETLLFVSMILFSCILLPTFVMLIMTFFTDFPRTESIFHGYRFLFESFGGKKWMAYGVAVVPYLLFQCIRTLRWVISAAKTDVE